MSKPLTWQPLGSRLPSQWTPVQDGRRLLTPQNISFVQRLMALRKEATPQAAKRGIALLDTVPQREEQVLDLVTFRTDFLAQLGQSKHAQAMLLDHIVAMESEALWLQRGSLLLDWLVEHEEGEVREQTLTMLREICSKHDFLAPPMILAFGLSQGCERPPREARELFQTLLYPKRWRKFPKRVAFWLEHLAGGFFSYIDHLTTQEKHKEARQYGRMIPKFPWAKFPNKFTPNAMHLLCLSLFQLNLSTELKQISDQVRNTCPRWSEPHYWLGTLAIQRNNPKLALKHFQKAIALGGLDEAQKRSLVSRLMSAGLVEGLDEFFHSFEDRNHLDTLRLSILYHLYRDELEEALLQCDAILAILPDDLSAQLYTASLLEALQRWEQAEALLTTWLTQSHPTLFVLGHLLLGNVYIQTGRHSQALACFRALNDGPFPYHTVLNPQWQRSFLLLFGESLQRDGEVEDALLRYQEAHELSPSGALYTRMLWILIRLERWEQAEQLSLQARSISATLPWFQCALLQLHEHFERWDKCLQILEQIPLSWFQQQGILREGLATKIRALFFCDQPWNALVCCEEWIDFVSADPELKVLRRKMFAVARTQVEAMQRQLGEQAQKLIEFDQQKLEWKQQQRKQKKREELFQQVLQQEGLHQDLRSLQQRNALFQHTQEATHWEREHPERFETLSQEAKPLLANAAYLWDSLAPYPKQDHGPVIVQLSRVVEAELYHHLISPLLNFARQEGIPLSSLPSLSIGEIDTSQPRISLADSGSLLYSEVKVQESDGSYTVMRNPRSNPTHQKLLEAFWAQKKFQKLPKETLRYAQSQLPLELQTLARQRNPSSHANLKDPQSNVQTREQVQPVLDMLWGGHSHLGILKQLTLLPLT